MLAEKVLGRVQIILILVDAKMESISKRPTVRYVSPEWVRVRAPPWTKKNPTALHKIVSCCFVYSASFFVVGNGYRVCSNGGIIHTVGGSLYLIGK